LGIKYVSVNSHSDGFLSTKDFPWGDGKTGVFHQLFGNPYAEEEDEE
jgi:hypothetical protein